jgi:predicted neuraminidase
VRNGEVRLLGKPEKIAEPEQHLLGRCNPLTRNGRTLLPLYDEVTGECVIFEGEGTRYEEVGRYGEGMIQPTIWEHGTNVCSLSRNFRSTIKKARYCESTDGKAWSEPTWTPVWNINNSVQVTKWNGEDFILWNDTNGRWRRNMTLGTIQTKEGNCGFKEFVIEPIEVVGAQHGSYPSMCVDFDGNLNFSFTNALKEIEYHVWNTKTLKRRRGDPARRRRAADQNRTRS